MILVCLQGHLPKLQTVMMEDNPTPKLLLHEENKGDVILRHFMSTPERYDYQPDGKSGLVELKDYVSKESINPDYVAVLHLEAKKKNVKPMQVCCCVVSCLFLTHTSGIDRKMYTAC